MLNILKNLFNKENSSFEIKYDVIYDEDNIKIYKLLNDNQIKYDEQDINYNENNTNEMYYTVTNMNLSEDKLFLYIDYENVYELYYDQNNLIDEYKAIGLPDLYNGFMKISNEGNFNVDKKVLYSRFFEDGINKDIYIFKKNILKVDNKFKLMPKSMYKLLKKIKNYNDDEDKQSNLTEQFRLLADIKDYANKTNILLEPRIEDEPRPIIIDNIKIDFEDDGETTKIYPIIDKDKDLNESFLNELYSTNRIKNFYGVKKGKKRNKVLFKNSNTLKKIKDAKELNGQKRLDFLKGTNELLFDDEIDLSLYGPRVKGLGILNCRPNSTSNGFKDGSWFDTNKVFKLPRLYTNDESFVLKPHHKELLQDKLYEMKEEKVDLKEVEFEKDNKKYKVIMDEVQLRNEIEKISDCIKSVQEIKNINELKIIKDKMIDQNSEYIEHKGVYIKNTNPDVIDYQIAKIQNLKEERKKDKEKTLIPKDNIDIIEYEEEKVEAKNFKLELPKSLIVDLYKHQLEGFAKLQKLYKTNNINGFLLADDMGLGKSLQILTLLGWLKELDKLKPALIVAPKTLLNNWDNDNKDKGEIQKFFKEGTFSTYKIRGRISEFDIQEIENRDIVLISYDSLRINQKILGKIHWSSIICDEAQKFKNSNTLLSAALKVQNADFKIACSATPIENSTLDLWNIMDFSVPGILGSMKEFKTEYVKKINNLKSDSYGQREDLNNLLVSKIENNFLRRSKEEELKDLPNKIIKLDCIKMNEYELDYIEKIHSMKRPKESVLPLIQKLIGVCSHPRLVGINNIDESIEILIRESSKLKYLKAVIDKIKNKDEKVIIFTIFKKMQSIIVRALKYWYSIDVNIVNGTISDQNRTKRFNSFRNSKGFDVIVLSPEVAGVGITLTEANHVIHYTRLWNPAKEVQATDRVYRIGQDKEVYVYYPILTYDDEYNKTFRNEDEFIDFSLDLKNENISPDEKLNKLLARKKNMLNKFFLASGDNNLDMSLEWEMDGNSKITIDSVISILGAYEFEALCSLIYKKQGYETYLTVKSGDKGVDIFAIKDEKYYLIQSKHTKNKKISKEGFAEVWGAKEVYKENLKIREIENLIVMTTAKEVTIDIKEFAGVNKIKMILFEELSELLNIYNIDYEEIAIENKNRYSIEQIKWNLNR